MRIVEQSQVAWIEVLLVLPDGYTPVTGKAYTDFTVKYAKMDDNSFVTKVLSLSDFEEIGNGVYRIRFTSVELDTLGIMVLSFVVNGARPVIEYIDVSRVLPTQMVHKTTDWDPEVSAESTHRSLTMTIQLNGVFYNLVDKAVVYDKSLLTKTYFKQNEKKVSFVATISGLDYDATDSTVKFTMRRQDDPLKAKTPKIDSAAAELVSSTDLGDGTWEIVLKYTFVGTELSDLGVYWGEFEVDTDSGTSEIINFFPDEVEGFPIQVISSI